jgi:PleD family two-component response regulator
LCRQRCFKINQEYPVSFLSSRLVQKNNSKELITKFSFYKPHRKFSNKMNKDDKTYSILVVEDNLTDSNRIEQLLMQLDFDQIRKNFEEASVILSSDEIFLTLFYWTLRCQI